MIQLSIITIGYFSQKTLPALLMSINNQVECSFEFIYVENSPDLSAIPIVKQFCPFAIILEPFENLGFSKGCNFGASQANGKYLLFLNPDCEISTNDTLKNMIQYMHLNPAVGICCPRFINRIGQIKSGIHGHYFGEHYVTNDFKLLPGNFAWVSGAALMISDSLFKNINGFDERFFMYFDDVDIGLRVRKSGFVVSEVIDAIIMHSEGASVQKAWSKSEGILKIELARSLFTAKNYLPLQHKMIWKKYRVKKLLDIIKNYLLFQAKRLPGNLEKFRFASNMIKQFNKDEIQNK